MLLVGFVLQIVDIVGGMGFGTLVVPLLLVLGFSPLEVVPTVLITNVFCSAFSALMHESFGNVKWNSRSKAQLKWLGILGALGAVGGLVFVRYVPQDSLEVVIGIIVVLSGFLMLIPHTTRKHYLSKSVLLPIAGIASFTQAVAGVFGPIVTAGQVLGGVKERYAVALSKVAEGMVSVIALGGYLLLFREHIVVWHVVALTAGAIVVVPFSARLVKVVDASRLRAFISVLTIAVGLMTLEKVLGWQGILAYLSSAWDSVTGAFLHLFK